MKVVHLWVKKDFLILYSILNLYYPSWTSNFQTLKWMMKGCLHVWTVHRPYRLLSNFSILFCSGWIHEKCFSDNSKTIETDSCCFLVSSLSFYHHFIPWSSSPMQFYDQLQLQPNHNNFSLLFVGRPVFCIFKIN